MTQREGDMQLPGTQAEIPHQARLGMACPHCGGPARIRTSRSLTRTYRQISFQCLDAACGHTFGAELTVTHTISPSARPNPDVQLRVAPQRKHAASANDQPCGPEVPPAAGQAG